MTPPVLLTTTDAAAIALVNRRTVLTWIHKNILPATQLPGVNGEWRIEERDLLELVNGKKANKR